MKSGILKKTIWALCGLFLLALPPMAWKLKTLEKKAARLSEEILQTRQTALRCDREADSIRAQLDGWKQDLEKNTVSIEDPITYCYEWINDRVGLSSDIEIECIGTKPPNGMAIGRASRSAMEGTMAALVPCAIRLDLRETTLGKLQYILEQIEAPESAAIVQYLNVSPAETGEGFSAIAIISFPSFLYPQDWRDVRDFLGAGD